MSNRWKMNRMGFINFWLYDEEIFSFLDGKLLLRGQNGSGKSITTQSFIPFILDGDRTPSRLDPFGSSDRRMEYYFLGESGKTESTGYLFLEFKRENKEQYRTIGIGQRAQAGKPMAFWGFVILDGRRVGIDLNLYQEVGAKKIPFTKQQLKNALGEANPYTEVQREYMDFVNKYIFGFSNIEQYGQFIKLLIKVRAPKLSKEFKPTKVYDILNDSLQTLSDEDLRAMVEAMEKMDDIQSRLDGLRDSYRDLLSIREIYSRYNLYMLGKKAKLYVDKKKAVDKIRKNLEGQETEIEDKKKEIEEKEVLSEKYRGEIELLNVEKESLHLETLDASLEELERKRKKQEEAKKRLENSSEVIEDLRTQILDYDRELRECEGEIESRFSEIEELMRDLDDENDILSFEYHSNVREVLDRMNITGDKDKYDEDRYNKSRYDKDRYDEDRYDGGRYDKSRYHDVAPKETSDYYQARQKFGEILHLLEQLEMTISQGYEALKKKEELFGQWSEKEEELQQQLLERDKAGAEYENIEKMETECRDQLIEKLYDCSVQNEELKFTKDELGKLSEFIQHYESPEQMGDILEFYNKIWMQRKGILERERLETQNEARQLQQEKERLTDELENIEAMPMAIPQRREQVKKARERLLKEGITFLPFYEAVDFADEAWADEEKAKGPKKRGDAIEGCTEEEIDDITQEQMERKKENVKENSKKAVEKSRIEGQLEAAGILDALVIPRKEQERARQILKDLSDSFLFVHQEEPDRIKEIKSLKNSGSSKENSSSKKSGKPYPFLKAEDLETDLKEAVDDILSSISEDASSAAEIVIAEDGYFRNGLLEGYCHSPEEASYIGSAARKRKKEELLRQKREELEEVLEKLCDFNEKLEHINQRIQKLEGESLPSFEDLNVAISLRRSSQEKLERAKERVSKKEVEVGKKKEEYKNQEQQVIKICGRLPYFRTLEGYKEVLESARDYKKIWNHLKDVVSEWELKKMRADSVEELRQKEEERLDEAYLRLREEERQVKEITVQIQHLEAYLNNPEMKKMRERLEEIRGELEDRETALRQLEKQLTGLEKDIEYLTKAILELREIRNIETQKEEKLRRNFEEELDLKFVMEKEEGLKSSLYDMAVKAEKLIKEMDKTRTASEMTAALMRIFHAHLSTLTSYGIMMEECFVEGLQRDEDTLRTRQVIWATWNGKKMSIHSFYELIKDSIEQTELLIQQKDRELFEGILADTLSRKLSNRIRESRRWIKDMSSLMKGMDTSMALTFSLDWKPRGGEGGSELDTKELERILGRDRELLTTEDIDKVSAHFRTKIHNAKREAEERGEVVNYTDLVRDALDYRKWFIFQMNYYRNDENKRELTNAAFNRFSGGEKAMAMYVPLFAAVNAQYKKAENKDHPRIIALDEAFAGVDDKNINSMFELVQKMDFDYIMNSQVLWGCYENVKNLKIAELLRPANSDIVTVIYYSWNGVKRTLDEQ